MEKMDLAYATTAEGLDETDTFEQGEFCTLCGCDGGVIENGVHVECR